MSTLMEPEKNVHLNLPEPLLTQMQETADSTHMTVDELVKEAVQRYMADRSWTKLYAYGEGQTAQRLKREGRQGSLADDEAMGYVDCLIHEHRNENQQRGPKEQGR